MQRMKHEISIECECIAERIAKHATTGRRRGFTLLEMITVISMLGTVMILTGATFQILMQSEKAVSLSFVTERSVSRLAVQFRDDVHRADLGTVKPATDDAKLELVLGDSNGPRVRYVQTKEGLARLSIEGDEVVAREDFRLPDCQLQFVSGEGDDAQMRTLVIARPGATATRPAKGTRPLRSLEIQACLNRFGSHSRLDSIGNGDDREGSK